MMLFLINNWKSLVAMLATAVLAYGLHALDVYRLEDMARADLAAQAQKLNDQCKADKAITEGVSNDYRQKLNTVSDQLAALKRVRPARCVPVSAPVSATGDHGGTQAAGLPRADGGIVSDALLDFAADAERVRQQLIGCQSFITQTWAAKEQ